MERIQRACCCQGCQGKKSQEETGFVLSAQVKKKRMGTPGAWQGGPHGSSLGGQEVITFQNRTETSYGLASSSPYDLVFGLVLSTCH